MTVSEPRPRRRAGGRAGAARRAAPRAIPQPPWDPPRNSDAPTEPLSPEAVEAIHDGAMRVLEEVGIDFLHPEARAVLAAEGCDADPGGVRVRMGRDFVMEKVALAPPGYTVIPRNPDRAIPFGGDAMVFGAVASPPSVMDLDRGKRPGDRESYRDLLKLTQYFDCLHFSGGWQVEPVDLHPSTRHLDALFDMLTLTDKAAHAYCLGPERIEDAMEMVRIAAGLTPQEFDARPRLCANINSSSPLKHDWPMLDGAMRLARRGQPVMITPFTLAGAMAPVTLAGAVTQSVAEGLAAVALLQCIRPGVGCTLGSFTSNVDMRSGSPAFGTPEYMRATQMAGQMARRYRLPFRASNACASNAPDGQAMWESAFSLWACVSGGANVVYHAAGWLEGGLIASYEKFVMDCELIRQMQAYMRPVAASAAEIAVDAIAEVGSSGHFFGAAHTRERYQTAFYQPFLSDWRNHEAWAGDGGVWTAERANRLWKTALADCEAPPMDEAAREELAEFVERRRREGGALTDF